MEAVVVTISRLIEYFYLTSYAFRVSEFGVKDVGNLRLGIEIVADNGTFKSALGGFVDEFSVLILSSEGRPVGKHVAGGSFAHLGVPEHCNALLEDVKEGNIACLYRLDESLCFFLSLYRLEESLCFF